MRRLLVSILVLLPVSVAGAGTRTQGRPVTIQFNLRFTVQNAASGTIAGTFNATGAISASGRATDNYILSPPRLRSQQPVETVTAASRLKTPAGTMSGSYTGVVSSASPTMTVTEGTWRITKGSGRFLGLHGSGRFSAIVDLARKTMVRRYDGLASR